MYLPFLIPIYLFFFFVLHLSVRQDWLAPVFSLRTMFLFDDPATGSQNNPATKNHHHFTNYIHHQTKVKQTKLPYSHSP